MSLVVDSDRHCPRDGKRLVADIGQHESRGDVEIRHVCWHCGWYDPDSYNHATVRLTAAELMRRRLSLVDRGVSIPWAYDESPFPPSEFDQEAIA